MLSSNVHSSIERHIVLKYTHRTFVPMLLGVILLGAAACGNDQAQPNPAPTASLSQETARAVDVAQLMIGDVTKEFGDLELTISGPATATGVSYSGAFADKTGLALIVSHGAEADKDYAKRVKSARDGKNPQLETIVVSDVAGQKGVNGLQELAKDYHSGKVLARRQVEKTVYVAEISVNGWRDSTGSGSYTKLQEIAAKRLSEIK